jgi:hypothetical protein
MPREYIVVLEVHDRATVFVMSEQAGTVSSQQGGVPLGPQVATPRRKLCGSAERKMWTGTKLSRGAEQVRSKVHSNMAGYRLAVSGDDSWTRATGRAGEPHRTV